MTDQPNQDTKKEALKKKRLLVILLTVGVILLLVLLNTLDFERESAGSETTEAYTPETKPESYFFEPDYESDIFSLPAYTGLDLTVSYTFSGQTVSLEGYLYDQPYSEFFVSYFEALQKGFAGSSDMTEGFNAFYSPVYFRKHATFDRFAPQKVYDIEISRISDPQTVTVAETEEDKAYIGATLTVFEVRYKIFQNDGTFRRDAVEDALVPQVITLLCDKGGNLSISAVGYYRYVDNTSEGGDSLLMLVMPLVWVVLALVLTVLTFVLKKLVLLPTAISAFAAFLVSIKGALWIQLLVFFPLAVLLTIGLLLLRKKRKKAASPSSSSAQDSASE